MQYDLLSPAVMVSAHTRVINALADDVLRREVLEIQEKSCVDKSTCNHVDFDLARLVCPDCGMSTLRDADTNRNVSKYVYEHGLLREPGIALPACGHGE